MKYRTLSIGEMIQKGDEVWYEEEERWIPARLSIGHTVRDGWTPIRRATTEPISLLCYKYAGDGVYFYRCPGCNSQLPIAHPPSKRFPVKYCWNCGLGFDGAVRVDPDML